MYTTGKIRFYFMISVFRSRAEGMGASQMQISCIHEVYRLWAWDGPGNARRNGRSLPMPQNHTTRLPDSVLHRLQYAHSRFPFAFSACVWGVASLLRKVFFVLRAKV